jgi:hypothetical protein
MGRPKLAIDESLVFELAKIHCTVEEIATICKCTRETLYARFSDIIKKGKAEGKSSLRRLQWESAQKGSAAMQIWLGKQLLKQRDVQAMQVTNDKPTFDPIQIRMIVEDHPEADKCEKSELNARESNGRS